MIDLANLAPIAVVFCIAYGIGVRRGRADRAGMQADAQIVSLLVARDLIALFRLKSKGITPP